MKAAGRTDRGKIRQKNEDEFILREDPYPILAVADGMGGHKAGDVASAEVIETVKNYAFKPDFCSKSMMENLVIKANESVIKKGENNPAWRGMGTTLSAAAVYDNYLYYGHVGDSRIYLLREKELFQISRDHSLVGEMLDEGKISPEEAFNHPRGNVLTQAIGLEKNLDIDTGSKKLLESDAVLLCTDGLTDMLPESEICRILLRYRDEQPENACKDLIEAALNSGGKDNITAVVYEHP